MLDYILFFLFILYIAFLPTCDSYKCGGVADRGGATPGLRSFQSLDRVTLLQPVGAVLADSIRKPSLILSEPREVREVSVAGRARQKTVIFLCQSSFLMYLCSSNRRLRKPTAQKDVEFPVGGAAGEKKRL